MSFIPSVSKSVSKVHAPVNGLSGTLASTDITCDIYSDLSANPNASIESRNTISATLAGSVFGVWTGFTTTLTAGTRTWVVWKNVNATPASNNITVRRGNTAYIPDAAYVAKTTTNSGGAWSNANTTATFWVEYNDGSAEGFPFLSNATSGTGTRVFNTNENGNIFTVPPGPILPVIGLEFPFISTTGTPTGNLRGRLYSGSSPSLLGTTNSIPVSQIIADGANVQTVWFSSAINISPGQIIRATMSETTQTDTNSNAYTATEITIDSDPLSQAMMPFRGTMQQTYFNGTSWAQTATVIIPMRIILDSSQEIGIAGSGVAGLRTGGRL